MNFLRGLFTQHLATKFMALLLSVVLFAFVHQSLVGRRTVEEIGLNFELAPELRGQYSVLTPTIRLHNVALEGTVKEVNPVAIQFELIKTRTIEVDEQFLRLSGDIQSIQIDEKFLHLHKILPDEIRVTNKFAGDPRLKIERNEESTLTIELAAGMEGQTEVKADNIYEGTEDGGARVKIEFSMKDVRVRAPPSAFRDKGRTIKMKLGSVETFLREYTGSAGRVRMKNEVEVDWEQSQLTASVFFRHAEFSIAGNWVSFAEFLSQITADFEVRDRKKTLGARLPIRFVVTRQRGLAFLNDNYEFEGPEGPVDFSRQDYLDGRCADFQLRVPPNYGLEDIKPLVLVMDIAGAVDRGDKLDVWVHLDVTDADRGDLLRLVEIKLDYERDTPAIRFKKK